jgi:hypothetical protein
LVERVLGKDEVMGSSPITSSGLGSNECGIAAAGYSDFDEKNVAVCLVSKSQLFGRV